MKVKKIILPVGVLTAVLTIATIISFSLVAYLGSNSMTFNLSSFNWEGVDGITNIFMTVVTLVFLYGIIQAKETHSESAKARKQSTNASDAEVLRWAMDEMGKRKDDIKLVTNAYKKELQNLLTDKYGYINSDESFDTDKGRMDHIESMKKHMEVGELENFYSNVLSINGEEWSENVKDTLHKEVSIIMQRMGYMALFSLISKQHFINLWGPMFLACWYSIEWYIKDERGRLGENLNPDKNLKPGDFIDQFGSSGRSNREYEGAFFRIHLETFIRECENKLPLLLVNNERLKFGREPLLE
jgi:uncharacterized membrane protein